MLTQHNGVWTVPLGDWHRPYTEVKLKRELPNNDGYTVVIVDVATFMECFERDIPSYVIPTVDRWPAEKREGIQALLDPGTGPPWMSRVSLRIEERRRFWGLGKPSRVAIASFTNGRHRARYLQFAGAKCMPVEATLASADLLREHCGGACL